MPNAQTSALKRGASQHEADKKIREQIVKGYKLIEARNKPFTDFEPLKQDYATWRDENIRILALFFEQSIVERYRYVSREIRHNHNTEVLSTLQGDKGLFYDYVRETLDFLEQTSRELDIAQMFADVFLVHGHDEAAKESIARFIERLGLHPVILHEQPNAGRTIIEKFEGFSNVGFAVVLLTPDDIGADKDKRDELKPRARQNVILELGYFMGKLGRGRVCALYKEGVEIPSDYQGVLYITMDDAGAWRMALANEIRHAGIEVDLNKI